jgi:hypothetical protein
MGVCISTSVPTFHREATESPRPPSPGSQPRHPVGWLTSPTRLSAERSGTVSKVSGIVRMASAG